MKVTFVAVRCIRAQCKYSRVGVSGPKCELWHSCMHESQCNVCLFFSWRCAVARTATSSLQQGYLYPNHRVFSLDLLEVIKSIT